MLLMVEKSIRDKTSHAIYQYFKANNKYMKDCYKNKESSFVKYWAVIICTDEQYAKSYL